MSNDRGWNIDDGKPRTSLTARLLGLSKNGERSIYFYTTAIITVLAMVYLFVL